MGVRTANVRDGNIGETLTGLAEVIHGRRDASPQESYTFATRPATWSTTCS